MTDPFPIFAERRHTHLKLAAAIAPGPRALRPQGFPRPPKHSDRAGHGRIIEQFSIQVRSDFERRSTVFGVEPNLVLVLESNRQIDPSEVQRAGLTILELRSDRALVAFASDPDLAEFRSRVERYRQGVRGLTEGGNERPAAYENLFDAIEQMRTLNPADVLSPALATLVSGSEPSSLIRIDVQCWCPEDEVDVRARNAEVASAVESAGGVVLSTAIRLQAGLSALCVDVPADKIFELAAVDRIRWLDTIPHPLLSNPKLRNTSTHGLPAVQAPHRDAPIVAVIDSGVRSAHPLLAQAVVGVEYLGSGMGDGGDAVGHGTLVASLALYGSLELRLDSGETLRPAGRLLSIRVLDADNNFPDDRNWTDHLLEAMEIAVAAGARVINLSLGDPRRPYVPARPTPAGASVDAFIRRHPSVVVVVSVGNFGAHEVSSLLNNTYPADGLERPDVGILDPAPAALALTVGALCGDLHQGAAEVRVDANVRAVGRPSMPSPFTRLGPGPSFMVKPELCAPGGSLSIDTLVLRPTKRPATSIVGAGGADPEHLLATDSGTSFAAPLVSHAALRVLARYPALTGNGVRALLLVAAEQLPSPFDGAADAEKLMQQRRLTGYGAVSASRAEASADHRVVMVSEASIVIDEVHIYVVPMPATFFVSGGVFVVSVALAFDPPVRATRLDYLANRMNFQAYFGVSVDTVRDAYAREIQMPVVEEETSQAPSQLRSSQLDLQPANADRSRGAHQFGTYRRTQRFPSDRGREIVIAVRNVNRWDAAEARQDYALAVTFARDTGHGGLYAELSAELQPLAELEAGIEIELEN